MRKFSLRLTAVSDLIMHNGRTANPIDPATREIEEAFRNWKRQKTDEAFYQLARAEFMGSLYYHEQDDVIIGPYWPSENLHSALKRAGAKVKAGRATLKNPIAAALFWESEINPLSYAGPQPGRPAPRAAADLWDCPRYRYTRAVRVGSSKVMRTRALFAGWGIEVSGRVDTEVLDLADLEAVARVAGQVVGIGDWRPEKGGTYGRFETSLTDLGDYDPLRET